MILPYAKPFNKKMREQLIEYRKNKKYKSNFSTLLIDDMKTKKKHESVLLVKKYSTIANTQQYLHYSPKGLQLY